MKFTYPLALLAILASGVGKISAFWNEREGRTPNIRMKHKPHPKFRRHAPNGKWVMKIHRGSL
uniref:Uncharacterized protein n=1 Tax=viral metagenome TaxID=1070528 RepID=A0A6M3KJJ1_9ZZZZ